MIIRQETPFYAKNGITMTSEYFEVNVFIKNKINYSDKKILFFFFNFVATMVIMELTSIGKFESR